MSKNKNSSNRTFEEPINNQEKFDNLENSIQVNGSHINQTHNSKKESLGPNTNR